MAIGDYGIETANDWPVNKVFIDTYEGDDANNRELDLGDDYDLVVIFLEESKDIDVSHLVMAYAVRTTYGTLTWTTAGGGTQYHRAGAAGNVWWQGKMSGGDADKIKLGSDGSNALGTNDGDQTYRILALKFGTVHSGEAGWDA